MLRLTWDRYRTSQTGQQDLCGSQYISTKTTFVCLDYSKCRILPETDAELVLMDSKTSVGHKVQRRHLFVCVFWIPRLTWDRYRTGLTGQQDLYSTKTTFVCLDYSKCRVLPETNTELVWLDSKTSVQRRHLFVCVFWIPRLTWDKYRTGLTGQQEFYSTKTTFICLDYSKFRVLPETDTELVRLDSKTSVVHQPCQD